MNENICDDCRKKKDCKFSGYAAGGLKLLNCDEYEKDD
jgi:hypothetical protein